MFQFLAGKRFVKEDEQIPFLAGTSQKPAKARVTDVIPHLDPAIQQGMLRLPFHVVNAAAAQKRTRRQRVLPGRRPLTKEDGPQCLTEEPLTLSRNGVRRPGPTPEMVEPAGLAHGELGGGGPLGVERRA